MHLLQIMKFNAIIKLDVITIFIGNADKVTKNDEIIVYAPSLSWAISMTDKWTIVK